MSDVFVAALGQACAGGPPVCIACERRLRFNSASPRTHLHGFLSPAGPVATCCVHSVRAVALGWEVVV